MMRHSESGVQSYIPRCFSSLAARVRHFLTGESKGATGTGDTWEQTASGVTAQYRWQRTLGK